MPTESVHHWASPSSKSSEYKIAEEGIEVNVGEGVLVGRNVFDAVGVAVGGGTVAEGNGDGVSVMVGDGICVCVNFSVGRGVSVSVGWGEAVLVFVGEDVRVCMDVEVAVIVGKNGQAWTRYCRRNPMLTPIRIMIIAINHQFLRQKEEMNYPAASGRGIKDHNPIRTFRRRAAEYVSRKGIKSCILDKNSSRLALRSLCICALVAAFWARSSANFFL